MATTRSTDERGYGAQHQAERDTWKSALASGLTVQCACTRPDCPHHQGQCPTMISDGDDWDLGHTEDRTGYHGPECRPCNRSDGGRKAHITSQMIIREW